MHDLDSAARTNYSLAELPSGIYALQAKRTTLDHPVWQRACSNNEGGWGERKKSQEKEAEQQLGISAV